MTQTAPIVSQVAPLHPGLLVMGRYGKTIIICKLDSRSTSEGQIRALYQLCRDEYAENTVICHDVLLSYILIRDVPPVTICSPLASTCQPEDHTQ